MIYLKNTTEAQVAYVPKDSDATGLLKFALKSTVDLDTVINGVVLDLNIHRLYIAMSVQLPEGCPAGEYQYQLTAGGDPVSSGIAIVKDDREAEGQYNKVIKYEQYTD
jgi:hypothetical protein